METGQRPVSNLILILWAIITLAVLLYFFVLCSLYIDDFFLDVVSTLPMIFGTITCVMITTTSVITFLFIFSIFSKTQTILKWINFVILGLAIVAAIAYVSTCFANKTEYYNRAIIFIITYPDDFKTKTFKIKNNVKSDNSNLSKTVSSYMRARINAPPIAICIFIIPWLSLHIWILHHIRRVEIS